MTAIFPTNIVSTSDIPNTNPLTSLSANNHSGKHNQMRDELVAIETKLGKNGDSNVNSVDYKLNEITGGDEAVGKAVAQELLQKILGLGTKITLGLTAAVGDMFFVSNVNGLLSKLGIGTNGQTLFSNGTSPYWGNPGSANLNFGVDTGSANAYAINLTPDLGAYAAGVQVQFIANFTNTGSATANVDGLGAKTIKKFNGVALVAGDIVQGMMVTLEYDGTDFYLINAKALVKFGGDGSDGALAVSSGNTNIDCANTSIAITGTGKVTFINPHANGTTIVLKSQGNVTLTSSQTPMLDASGMGAAGGVGTSAAVQTTGATGNQGIGVLVASNPGTGGTAGSTVGAGGAIASFLMTLLGFNQTRYKYWDLFPGSGGAAGNLEGGGGANATAPSGGRGGGALLIECAGAWNFTTANGISVAGLPGAQGTANATNQITASGSGGGSAGQFRGMYNRLTSNTGSVTVTGGIGGNSDSGASVLARRGGGGGGYLVAGNPGTSNTAASAKTGGDGAVGASNVFLNNDFA
jgi:hypothetical protein